MQTMSSGRAAQNLLRLLMLDVAAQMRMELWGQGNLWFSSQRVAAPPPRVCPVPSSFCPSTDDARQSGFLACCALADELGFHWGVRRNSNQPGRTYVPSDDQAIPLKLLVNGALEPELKMTANKFGSRLKLGGGAFKTLFKMGGEGVQEGGGFKKAILTVRC